MNKKSTRNIRFVLKLNLYKKYTSSWFFNQLTDCNRLTENDAILTTKRKLGLGLTLVAPGG